MATPEIPFVPIAVLVLHLGNVGVAASRTSRMVAPSLLFEELNGGGFVDAGPWDFGKGRVISLPWLGMFLSHGLTILDS